MELNAWSFNYEPGTVRVEFAHDEFDYIRFDVWMGADRMLRTDVDNEGVPLAPAVAFGSDVVHLPMYVSAVFCPFTDLVAFLEAVVTGVQECAFGWDAEGPEGKISWTRSFDDMGHLMIRWYGGDEQVCLLRRSEVVRAFYEAFRGFVDSSRYDPGRYEEPGGSSGISLRTLRSPRVEEWLAGQPLLPPSGMAD